MTGNSGADEGLGRPSQLDSRPFTVPLNKTRTSERIDVSLLALVLVDNIVRLSGLIRLNRPDLRIAHALDLVVSPLEGSPLIAMGSHVVPTGDLTWAAWTFARPRALVVPHQARLEQIELAYRSGGRSDLIALGPWVFDFRIPCRRTGWRAQEPPFDPERRLDA